MTHLLKQHFKNNSHTFIFKPFVVGLYIRYRKIAFWYFGA